MVNGHLGWLFGLTVTALLGALGWLMKRHFDDDRERHDRVERAIEELRKLTIEEIRSNRG